MKQLKKETFDHYTLMINEMDKLNMNKEQQIEHLKSCLLNHEYQMRKKIRIERLLFSSFLFVLLGFYFIFFKLYIVGILFIIIPNLYISYHIIMLAEETKEEIKEKERKKLVSLLDYHLK